MTQLVIIEDVGNITVVRYPSGTMLDQRVSRAIAEKLHQWVNTKACNNMLLDFENVIFLSSNAIGHLLSLRQKIISYKEGKLVIGNSGKNEEILKSYKFETIKDKDITAALNCFESLNPSKLV